MLGGTHACSMHGFGIRFGKKGTQDSWLLASGFEFRVSVWSGGKHGSGFRVPGSGFRVSGFGFRDSGSGIRVPGFGFRVSGFGTHAQSVLFMSHGRGRKRVALKRTVVELRILLPHKRLVICTRRLVSQCRLKLESLLEHEVFLPSWNSRIFEKVCVLFETVA